MTLWLIISKAINISLLNIQPLFTRILIKVRYFSTKARSWLHTSLEKKPAWRKSWVRTANFWNNPGIGSLFSWLVVWTAAAICSETIFVCSNRWSHQFENNFHLFEQPRLSVQKRSSSSTALDPPYLAAEPFISTCSLQTLFFGRSNAWNHVPNVSLAVQTTGITPLKLFVSYSNGWQHLFKIFLSAFWMAGIICSKFFVSCLNGWYHNSLSEATILDKINGTSGPPLTPFQWCQNGAFLAPSRLHHCFGGDGG